MIPNKTIMKIVSFDGNVNIDIFQGNKDHEYQDGNNYELIFWLSIAIGLF